MKTFCLLLAHLLTTLAKAAQRGGARTIVAENLLLKHQLLVISRARRRAPNLKPSDRLFFGLLAFFLPLRRIARAAVTIRPSTLLRFHDALKRRKYRLLFGPHARGRPGPKGQPAEVIKLIVETKRRNPGFGCPRIASIVNRVLGLEIDKDIVRRVLATYCRREPDGGPSGLTFLGHTNDSLWSLDFFRCEFIRLRSHWVMVVMDQYSRRIVGFAVHAGALDGPAVCTMFGRIMTGKPPPPLLSTDHDPLFKYHRWRAMLRVLEIDTVKSVPYTPIPHPFVERLIGTIRREYLDHVFFWNAPHLERKLSQFQNYYNEYREHASLRGRTPFDFAENRPSSRTCTHRYQWRSMCQGLYQVPLAA